MREQISACEAWMREQPPLPPRPPMSIWTFNWVLAIGVAGSIAVNITAAVLLWIVLS